jgi:hypothetical protein
LRLEQRNPDLRAPGTNGSELCQPRKWLIGNNSYKPDFFLAENVRF